MSLFLSYAVFSLYLHQLENIKLTGFNPLPGCFCG